MFHFISFFNSSSPSFISLLALLYLLCFHTIFTPGGKKKNSIHVYIVLTNSMHRTWDWWFCFSKQVQLWLKSTSVMQDVFHCAVSSWSQPWWSISSSLLCRRWSGAMWAHLQASVESDLGAALLQPWLPSEGGFFFSFFSSTILVLPTVPSAPLDTLRHIWAAHPATMVTEEFY